MGIFIGMNEYRENHTRSEYLSGILPPTLNKLSKLALQTHENTKIKETKWPRRLSGIDYFPLKIVSIPAASHTPIFLSPSNLASIPRLKMKH